MKQLFLIKIIILLCMSSCWSQKNIVMEEEAKTQGNVFQLKVGENYEYSVRQTPSTGFYTTLEMPDSCAVSLEKVFDVLPEEPEPGMSSTVKYIFTGVYPGTCSVHFLFKNGKILMMDTELIFEVVEE